MGTLSTVFLELVFYTVIKGVHQLSAIHEDVTAYYPVRPCLGPSTEVIVDTFDLQGRNRERFALNGRCRPIVIVIIDNWSLRRATGILHQQR